ncbi:MAG: hypothetical protein U5J97_09905 [Trueperaceae bacterium]|nr:hypothetical protein [Trueperaceae bacterium]
MRSAFLATFAAQATVAAAVALGAVALAGRNVAPSPWIALVSILAAGAQVALGGAVAAYGVRQAGRLARGLVLHRDDPEAAGGPIGGDQDPGADRRADPEGGTATDRDDQRRLRVARSAALSQTLLSAVLLSTPTWFVAFAWATGQSATTLTALLATAALGIAFGMLQIGPLTRAVTIRTASSEPRPG